MCRVNLIRWLRKVLPTSTEANVPQRPFGDAEDAAHVSYCGGSIVVDAPNCNYVNRLEKNAWLRVLTRSYSGKLSKAVLVVLRVRDPLKILNPVVRFVTVLVIATTAFRSRSDERSQHQLVNVERGSHVSKLGVDGWIPRLAFAGGEDLSGSRALALEVSSNPTHIGDGVDVFVSDDGFPIFDSGWGVIHKLRSIAGLSRLATLRFISDWVT